MSNYNYHIISPKIDLSNHNYISKNTVYISNIPEEIYHKDILYQKKFLGQYGHINQIIFDKSFKKEKNIIVQFDTVNQASLCILSLENFKIKNENIIKANYFITKFCYYYLNNINCPNLNCLFIHNNNINDYHYCKINNPKCLNSFQFALDLLNITNHVFNLIKLKLIDENYYEKFKKFPKLKIKKLKNQEFIKNLFENDNNNNNKIQKKNKKNSQINTKNNNENLKNCSEDDSTNDSRNKNNYINKRIRRKISRFNFAKKENENNNFSIVIPDFVLDFLDKSTNEIYFQKTNFSENMNFHDNWSNILFGNNTCKYIFN